MMEGEDIKPLMYPDPASAMAYPTNQLPSLSSPEQSTDFDMELRNLTEDTNRLQNELNAFSSRELSSTVTTQNLGCTNTSVSRLTGPIPSDNNDSSSSSSDDHRNSLLGEAANDKSSHDSIKQEIKVEGSATTSGSARKRKNSKPVNYFDYIERQNIKSGRLSAEEDGLPSDQEDPTESEKVAANFDEKMMEDIQLSIKNVGTNYYKLSTLNHGRRNKAKRYTTTPYRCSQCGECFAEVHQLYKHVRTHSEQQLYICSICDENFFHSESLERHMKSHMTDDAAPPKYRCCTCSRSFADPDALSHHLETHHSRKYSNSFVAEVEVTKPSGSSDGGSSSLASSSTAQSSVILQMDAGANNNNNNNNNHAEILGKGMDDDSATSDDKSSFPKQRYPCNYCGFTFVSPSSLKTHVRTHTGEKPFQCSICHMTFSLSNNLLTHMRKHTGERPYKCNVCERGFTKSSDVTRHMRTHLGDKQCTICKKGFNNIDKLNAHIKNHATRKTFTCIVCSKVFCQRSNLNQHMKKIHSGYTESLKMHLMKVKKEKEDLEGGSRVDNCRDIKIKREVEPENLKKEGVAEMNRSEEGGPSNDSYMSDDTLPAEPFALGGGGGDNEDQTGKSLEDKKVWDLNPVNQLNAADFAARNLTLQQDYNGSAEDFHSFVSQAATGGEDGMDFFNVKPARGKGGRRRVERQNREMFKCTECNREFRSTSALNIHVRTHTGERPFECSMCDWTFSILGNLKAHMKTHSGEKPYRCDVCNKAFTKKCDVKRHLITHTGERNHMCVTCGKTFSQKCVLQTHMLLHSGEKPFKCTDCDKAFCQRVQLITHMKVHKGDRPYQCIVCDKRFREKSTYETHRRIHTGELPFECMLCGKFFRDKGYLRKHNKKHHNNVIF